jgi:hypothetical protein
MKNELGRRAEFDDESVHEKNKRIRSEQERRLRKELRHPRAAQSADNEQGDQHA